MKYHLLVAGTAFGSSLCEYGRVMVEQDVLLVRGDSLANASKQFDQGGIVMSDGCSLGLLLKAGASTDVRVVLGWVLLGCRHCLGYKKLDLIVSRLGCLKWTC